MSKIYNKPSSNKQSDRMRMNPLLSWLSDMSKILTSDVITVPSGYKAQVDAVKDLLKSDVSGFVNTILDYSIDTALVDYKIDSGNKNLTKTLDDWLKNLNIGLRGHIQTGVKALSKEYFRERLKGSSFLALRTFWEKKDGLILPTVLYFVDGGDIEVENKSESKSINKNTYKLRVSEDNLVSMGVEKDEELFIQKPYTPWGEEYPIPFLIQRGIYKNLKFLELLEQKGEFVVSKALEYLGILKKGTEGMALSNNPDFIYGEDDLIKIKGDFKKFLNERSGSSGNSIYATNFDTEFEHLIPEYERALKQELFVPIERRIFAGLGMVDIVQGMSSTRKESMLNPKPLFSEIKTCIDDFKALLLDVISVIVEKNMSSHRKYFKNSIKIQTPSVVGDLDSKFLTQVRGGYDRGVVSKQTYSEYLGMDFELEVDRRKQEEKLEEITYPPVTQNLEQRVDEVDKKENTPEDKKGIEKKNYNNASKKII